MKKRKSEILASRLKRWNLYQFFRSEHEKFVEYFFPAGILIYYNNVCNLIEALSLQKHDSCQWRLSIDAFNIGLNAVLLYIGNKYPSVPIAMSSK